MSHSKIVRVTIGSDRLPSEVTLRDSQFRPVCDAVTPVTLDVPAGAYEIELRCGFHVEKHLVKFGEIENYDGSKLGLGIYSSAPVSAASHRSQPAAEVASILSSQLLQSGRTCGLVVLLMQAGELSHLDTRVISVLNSRLERVTKFAEFSSDMRKGVAGQCAALDPGGYIIRYENVADDIPGLDVPVWLSIGFQTLAFIPCRPHPRLDEMSIHMTPINQIWTGFDLSANALELALLGLQRGKLLLAESTMRDALQLTTQNPMFGIVAAYALRGSEEHDSLRAELLDLLDHLLPGHPDVIALSPGSVKLRWPPSVAAGYYIVLHADAVQAATIESGSVAEGASTDLLLFGPWTTWASAATNDSIRVWSWSSGEIGTSISEMATWTSALTGKLPVAAATASAGASLPSILSFLIALRRLRGSLLRVRLAYSLRRYAETEVVAVLGRMLPTNGATDRVRVYLAGVAEVQGMPKFRRLMANPSSRTVAIATMLPVVLAQDAMSEIACHMRPEFTRRSPERARSDR